MTNYAFINSTNTVEQIIEGIDPTETQTDTDGTIVGGSVEAWETFYQNQTWHNYDLCKICDSEVAIGWKYHADDDVFVAPQPYPSWTLDENNDWQPPTPMPSTGGPYRWSEEELEWVAI